MFASRTDAGHLLGERLLGLGLQSPVVLGITRGGVVTAAEVARILKAPLYPLVIKKVSSPRNPEFAVGAVGPEGVSVGEFSKEARVQVTKRMKDYGVPLRMSFAGQVVVIVDDGIATGWTVKAAVQYAKSKDAGKIILAVPVADREIAAEIRKEVDELVVLEEVDSLGAVGNFYEEFSPVSDEEVLKILGEQGWGVDKGVKR